jgi:trigger factor
LPKSKIEILFEIPSQEFDSFREKAIFKLGEKLEVEGFRKGKVPKEIIESKISQNQIIKEATEMAIEGNYVKAIREKNLEPLGWPEIEIIKPPSLVLDPSSANNFEFKATISVLPEIHFPDYKEIARRVTRNKVSVEEKEIQDALSWLQKSRAKFTLKNQPAQTGDFVEIIFQSPQIDNNLEKKDGFILGQGRFLPGFEENLVGMIDGQEKEFSLKFPENHSKKDLSGKTSDFKVKMMSVQKVELPTVDNNFAKSLSNFEDFTCLKNSIREGLISEKEIGEANRVRREILEKINKNSDIDIPDILIEEEKERMLGDMKSEVVKTLQISFEEYLEKIKKTEKELRDSFSEEATRKNRYSLILAEIGRREKIEVSEEEIKKGINDLLKNLPSEKTKELDLKKLKLYIEGEIRKEKTFKFLEDLSKNT